MSEKRGSVVMPAKPAPPRKSSERGGRGRGSAPVKRVSTVPGRGRGGRDGPMRGGRAPAARGRGGRGRGPPPPVPMKKPTGPASTWTTKTPAFPAKTAPPKKQSAPLVPPKPKGGRLSIKPPPKPKINRETKFFEDEDLFADEPPSPGGQRGAPPPPPSKSAAPPPSKSGAHPPGKSSKAPPLPPARKRTEEDLRSKMKGSDRKSTISTPEGGVKAIGANLFKGGQLPMGPPPGSPSGGSMGFGGPLGSSGGSNGPSGRALGSSGGSNGPTGRALGSSGGSNGPSGRARGSCGGSIGPPGSPGGVRLPPPPIKGKESARQDPPGPRKDLVAAIDPRKEQLASPCEEEMSAAQVIAAAQTPNKDQKKGKRRKLSFSIGVLKKLKKSKKKEEEDGQLGSLREQAEVPLVRCVATIDFEAQDQTELGFEAGDVILVLAIPNAEWFKGRLANPVGSMELKIGVFPTSYVRILKDGEEPPQKTRVTSGDDPIAVALYEFDGAAGELSFSAGDRIAVLEATTEEWYTGKIGDMVGLFPAAFVQMKGSSQKALAKRNAQEEFPTATALFDFDGEGSDELSFQEGDVISILDWNNGDWYTGRTKLGAIGVFPAEYVEVVDDTNKSPVEVAPKRESDGFPKVKARFTFNGEETDEISFTSGDVITILDWNDGSWYTGKTRNGVVGVFPADYVDLMDDDEDMGGDTPGPSAKRDSSADFPTVRALFDFNGEVEDELSFGAGDIITILDWNDGDWYTGKDKGGSTGVFPADYVEVVEDDDATTEDQAGASDVETWGAQDVFADLPEYDMDMLEMLAKEDGDDERLAQKEAERAHANVHDWDTGPKRTVGDGGDSAGGDSAGGDGGGGGGRGRGRGRGLGRGRGGGGRGGGGGGRGRGRGRGGGRGVQDDGENMVLEFVVAPGWCFGAYDFEGQDERELSFACKDVIQILDKPSDAWWVGKATDGRTGYFPSCYVVNGLPK